MIDNEALNSLERLHKLKSDGVITETDFEAAKQSILDGRKPVSVKATQSTLAENDWIGWATLPLRKYADFNGRSSRKEFWMFQLLFLTMFLGCALIGVVIGPAGAAALFAVGLLGLFVPLLAVEARRFHDQDKSGWLVALNIIPYLGTLAVFVFMLLDGTPGDNRYGPNPKQS